MFGLVPRFCLVCFLALAIGTHATFNSASKVLRGSHIVHEGLVHHEHHEGRNHGYRDRHQAGTLLAVTDDAVDTAIKAQAPPPPKPEVDNCHGNRYLWMASMMKTCQNMFGAASYWDRHRRSFCSDGFKQCRPYYGACCTQPEGAVTLSAYCQVRSEHKHEHDDPACVVQSKINILQKAMARIPDVANRILLSKPGKSHTPAGPAWEVRDEKTLTTVDDESYHSKGAGSPETEAEDVGIKLTQDTQQVESYNAHHQMPPAKWERIFTPPGREVHCAELSHVLVELSGAIHQLALWREMYNGSKFNPGSMINQDPELLNYVDSIVAAGRALKQKTDVCSSKSEEDDEYDEETHQFLQAASESIVVGAKAQDTLPMLRTRMNGYMGFIGYMNFHVSGIETNVHPHGDRWWRYRYEQTVMEALFTVPFFAALIGLQRLLGRCLTAERHPSLRTSDFYWHLHTLYMHSSASVMLIMFVLWSLNATTPLFGWLAATVRLTWESCNDSAPNHCIFESVPFSGNAYYTMWTSIVMNLLGACMLYSLCVREFLRVSIKFLERLKASEQSLYAFEAEGPELEQYLAFQEFFCDRFAKMEKTDRLKSGARALGLDLDRHVTPDDLKRATFHRYLVVSLDHAASDLVMWSPSLLVTLIISCSMVACVAGWKKLSFAWLLPSILLMFFILLASAYLAKRALWTSTIKDKCGASMPWLSARGWITGVQTFLFMLSYSFSRFIFSKSMWTEYAWLAFWVLGGFIVLIGLTFVCIRDLMMRMVCVLSLPPNASTEVLEEYLEQMPRVAVDGKPGFSREVKQDLGS